MGLTCSWGSDTNQLEDSLSAQFVTARCIGSSLTDTLSYEWRWDTVDRPFRCIMVILLFTLEQLQALCFPGSDVKTDLLSQVSYFETVNCICTVDTIMEPC